MLTISREVALEVQVGNVLFKHERPPSYRNITVVPFDLFRVHDSCLLLL